MEDLSFSNPEVAEVCADMAAIGYFEGGFEMTARDVYDTFIGLGVTFERNNAGRIVLMGVRPGARSALKPKARGLIGGPNDNGPPPM
jgi:hypothetical protein